MFMFNLLSKFNYNTRGGNKGDCFCFVFTYVWKKKHGKIINENDW